MPKDETPKDEGPRSFTRLLEQVGEGDLELELATKMQELVGSLKAFSDKFQREGKGTLTLVLNVSAHGNGTVTVAGDIKTKTPTAKRAGSVFWLTPGNNLAVENPRQQKLPLKEVPPPKTHTKDISAEAPPVRGV
ncbi:MAG: hypothetical protein QOG85_838 [Gaiellaceae bacterium]|nr:hypothetical protein [Gaiellaceae bacterium]